MSLAQLLSDDPRPPWQVLLDALAASDAIMRDGIAVVKAAGDNLTPDQLDGLTQALERAAKLSKMTLDANVGERRTRLLESQTRIMTGSVQAALDVVLGQLVQQGLIDAAQEVVLRGVALEAAAQHAEAAGAPPPDPRHPATPGMGSQRFTRTAGQVRRAQAALPPGSSTAPGSAGPGSAGDTSSGSAGQDSPGDTPGQPATSQAEPGQAGIYLVPPPADQSPRPEPPSSPLIE